MELQKEMITGSLIENHMARWLLACMVACYAPKANIFVCCVSEENKFKQDAIIKALEVIQADNKCQVVVMSFGHLSDKEYDVRKKTSKVVLCVAAVGIIGLNAQWETLNSVSSAAGLENVIAVGGLTHFGHPLPLNTPGQIDMYAPGEVYAPGVTSNTKYQKCHGTSCAAPAIGGIVVLLKQMGRKSGFQISDVELIFR